MLAPVPRPRVSKGDILNADDLDLYCATAAAASNLKHVYNGHTVLEYLTGEVPRTYRDLLTPVALEEAMGDMDDKFLAKLRIVLRDSNTLTHHSRDDRSRYNALVRVSTTSTQREVHTAASLIMTTYACKRVICLADFVTDKFADPGPPSPLTTRCMHARLLIVCARDACSSLQSCFRLACCRISDRTRWNRGRVRSLSPL